jgi:putative FmdB family regulatory protein
MPIYEYRCDCGGTVEVLAAPGALAPVCPACGAETRKLVSGFAVGRRPDAGLSQSRMPQTWRGTYNGNPEYITRLQRQWEQRRRLEDRYPELAGDSRPIVAHEGSYSVDPLRAGDPGASTAAGGSAPAADASGRGIVGGGDHPAHPHGHRHTHSERPPPTRSVGL